MFQHPRLSHLILESIVDDKVWFTYKARIQAQLRLARLDFHSQLLLVWYAILGASLAVATIRYPHVLGKDTDILSAVLSIALLGISMAVTNRDFRGRSIAMRKNYLDLQHLHDRLKQNGTTSTADLDCYHELLSSAENHLEIDDMLFRVLNASTLTSRKPTCVETLKVYAYLFRRQAITLTLYLLPILIIWWIH
ncbi:SLATT domain-containing protein [Paludibacterium sp. B53371]|uniref:SLATT domain-containing protein n=1 Tax=Paludibacterium sp. B53371 TaxID=2806263 RepID=UPI0035301F42